MATITPPRKEPNLALLIDAETIAPRYISFITARILGRHGNPLLRRVYGDWASPRMSEWRRRVKPYELDAIERYRTWSAIDGSRHREAALVQDAFELAEHACVDVLCVASAARGLEGLATTVRNHGKRFVGLAVQGASARFALACDELVILDGMRGTIRGI